MAIPPIKNPHTLLAIAVGHLLASIQGYKYSSKNRNIYHSLESRTKKSWKKNTHTHTKGNREGTRIARKLAGEGSGSESAERDCLFQENCN